MRALLSFQKEMYPVRKVLFFFFMVRTIHNSYPLSLNEFGNKGASLSTMAYLGLPVPPGFILSVEMQDQYQNAEQEVFCEVQKAMVRLAEETGLGFGDPKKPLFVSVRSGAAVSMPGMMDTFLNVGLTDSTLPSLAARLSSVDAAHCCYVQWRKAYAARFYHTLLKGKELEEVRQEWKKKIGKPWNQDGLVQLWDSIKAVWASWNSPKAVAYRNQQGMSHRGGTAVIVQAMVFGNGPSSGTGVLFTRNPITGEKSFFGEYLPSAQGESLVSGEVTPLPLDHLQKDFPKIYEKLAQAAVQLECHYGNMQDVEFTFEGGELWMLQSRAGKRTALAAFKIASAFVQEKILSPLEALAQIDPQSLDQWMVPQLCHEDGLKLLAQGLPASPGTATGKVAFNAKKIGPEHILVLQETASEDVPAMLMAQGVVTLRGGMTSHASVIMRGMGKPCVVSLEGSRWEDGIVQIQGHSLHEGTVVTIDGTTGRVFLGEGQVHLPSMPPEIHQVLAWANGVETMMLLANADTVEDLVTGLSMGAQGVGLCRSEHMMFAPTRLQAMHEVILAAKAEDRKQALERLLPLHQADIAQLLRVLGGRLFTFRLLDPPLHEFLPQQGEALLARSLGLSEAELQRRIWELHEVNPMLGRRGCRVGIVFPEIYAMQVEALFRGAEQCLAEGIPVQLALMIPFVVDPLEVCFFRRLIQDRASVPYTFGIMIETPRAALLAGTLAKEVDFISFGTNDLTQMTWGLSRDDSSSFTDPYKNLGLQDPFAHFDIQGVGHLMTGACQQLRKENPRIKISVCGEHASQSQAIAFFQTLGVDALSCSPRKIPMARLAAAQSSISPP